MKNRGNRWHEYDGAAQPHRLVVGADGGDAGASSVSLGEAVASRGSGAGCVKVRGADGRGGRGHPHGRGRGTRRHASAGATLLAMLLGFFGAGLLDAGAIKSDIEGKPLGAARSIQLALIEPMVVLSKALRLDRPAASLNAALGRGEPRHHRLTEVAPEAKPKWPRAVTADEPLRLLIIGDSMAQAAGPSIKNLSEEAGLIRAKLDYKVSSGLSRPDFFNWPQHMIDQLIEADPDAIIVILGANDAQDFKVQGRVLRFGSASWRRAYQRRVGEAMKILTRSGRRVYWLGNPIMRDEYFRDRMALINGLYEAEARRHAGVQYVDTWGLLADEKGRYAEYRRDADGDLTLVRGADGIHMTRAGADLVAAHVLEIVRREWSISSADGG